MISTGRPYPEYNVYDDSVALTLRSVIEDVHFVRFIAKVQDDLLINFSLPELMILRYLSDNKKIKLSECEKMTQTNDRDSKHSLSNLVKLGLIESVGKEYVLTAKVYSAIKTDVEYTQDKVVQYLRAKDLILEYLKDQSSINIATVRELCRFDKSQAAYILKKMRKLGILEMQGKSIATKYVLKQ